MIRYKSYHEICTIKQQEQQTWYILHEGSCSKGFWLKEIIIILYKKPKQKAIALVGKDVEIKAKTMCLSKKGEREMNAGGLTTTENTHLMYFEISVVW